MAKILSDKEITICGHGFGKPSLKSLYTYSESRRKAKADNGKDKGIVCVRRFKKLSKNTLKRLAFRKAYKSILGRNSYSQLKREYVYKPAPDGKYYSDCSSSGMATLEKIGYKVGLLNTAGIFYSDLFEDVPVIIEKGHIMNPDVLKTGDCILFRGNDPKRPQQIGHVEYVYQRAPLSKVKK